MNRILITLAILWSSIAIAHATEDVLPLQLQKIESLQRRADNLLFGELDLHNYHLAKARTWLDLALSEYHDNDNSGVISAAINQANTLLEALERKQSGISLDTPLQITGSEALRADLLDKISVLKKHQKFSCGQRPLAQAEVYLVWAGHENSESGMSHAKSYLRNVEDLINTAQTAINNCATMPQPMAPTDLPHVMEKITLSGDALFAFDNATLNPSALSRLDKLAENIKMASMLEEVILVGHTDRMRSDRHYERNQLLSERRAESIKQYLIEKGIPADKIHASGAGSTQPLVNCSTKQRKAKQVACLQPNRRVEIILRGIK